MTDTHPTVRHTDELRSAAEHLRDLGHDQIAASDDPLTVFRNLYATLTALPEDKPGLHRARKLLALHKEQLLADHEPDGVRLLLDAMTMGLEVPRCPRCGRSLADYTEDEVVWRADDPRAYCSGECVVASQVADPTEEREDLLTTYRQMVAAEEFAPRGSLLDGTLRFLLGEIDRLRVVPAPAAGHAAEDERPLSPYYEHPECGFHWHGRDGMDIPMRDGQPVCPRCELRRLTDQAAGRVADDTQPPWLSDSARIGRTLIWSWSDVGKGAFGEGYRAAQAEARALLGGQRGTEADLPAVGGAQQQEADRAVAYRAPGSGWLYCRNCIDGIGMYAPLTSDDLPDGGLCDECGTDVLIEQQPKPFTPPAHYRRDDGVDCCVHTIPLGPDSCRDCRELADDEQPKETRP